MLILLYSFKCLDVIMVFGDYDKYEQYHNLTPRFMPNINSWFDTI